MASTTTPTAWDGNAMTQTDMMEKDTVLVLDDNDNVIGSASKRKSHEFEMGQPRGILHRAFSVFIFDKSTGKMLLQQRASTKITFPNVSRECVFVDAEHFALISKYLLLFYLSTSSCACFRTLLPVLSLTYILSLGTFLFVNCIGMDEYMLFTSTSWYG